MKTVKAIAAVALIIVSASAYANLKCGIKPIPPIGCDSSDAVCQCDANGNCEWVFIGCG